MRCSGLPRARVVSALTNVLSRPVQPLSLRSLAAYTTHMSKTRFLLFLLLITLPSVRCAHAIDQNSNGISDIWEVAYPSVPGSLALDHDGDGRTSAQEGIDGTNPLDPTDYFRTFDFTISPTLDSVSLSWRSGENRYYEIEQSTDLISWTIAKSAYGQNAFLTTTSLSIGSPLNDPFANRLPASTTSTQTIGSNLGATSETGEPRNPSLAGGKSVWWSWSSSAGGTVTISTYGSEFDTTLAVYSGNALSTLVLIASNDNSQGLQSAVTLTVQAGLAYAIQVDGYSGAMGSIILNHPMSSGVAQPPVVNPNAPPKMFFRVRGYPESDLDDDGDQLLTWEEALLGTNPNSDDSDNDGMDDGFEFIYQLNPLAAADAAADPDTDGLSNIWEYRLGLNPRLSDSDGDGITDPLEDRDEDGLTNISELNTYSTAPTQPDTDDDGLSDGWEVLYGYSALVNNETDADPYNNLDADPDTDGLTNSAEDQIGTNPNNADTDGDGANDFVEDQGGSNATGAGSTPGNPGGTPGGPATPPPPTVPVQVNFGDHSGSHSEKYKVCLEPIEGDANTRKRYRTNRKYGETQTETFNLPAGAKYKITLVHVATDPQYEGPPKPDYDYTLEFTSGSSNPAIASIPEDSTGMLGVHDESETYFAGGKSATLYVAWLTSETVATSPTDRKRKKLGVGEEVNLTVKPASLPSPTWALAGTAGATTLTPTSNTASLEAGKRACTPTAQTTILGTTLQIAFNVVQPSGERARKTSDMSFAAGTQGVGMELEIATLPDDVSFYNVEVIEIDKGTQNVTGFFTPFPASALQHHPNPSWIQLNQQNQWSDRAGFFGWGSSTTWAIEVRWRVVGKETGQGEVAGNRTQTHTLHDSTGRSTESKLSNTATRTP
jgi:hypothetical protein